MKLIFLAYLFTVNCFKEWWEETTAAELTVENFDQIVGKEKFVVVEFFTKWCKFCKSMAPEYEKLVERMKNTRKDVIIARVEGGDNGAILQRYNIYSFPTIGIFFPGDLKIQDTFNSQRVVNELEKWIINLAKPTTEIINNSTPDNDNKLQSSEEVTEEDDYVKQEFIDIKKRIENIEKQLNNIEMKKLSKKGKIVIEIDKSPISILIILCIIIIAIAFVRTVDKIIRNNSANKIIKSV